MEIGEIEMQKTEFGDIGAEQGVLAGILAESSQMLTVKEILPGDEYFSDLKHQQIYRAMQDLYSKGIGLDIITLSDQLAKEERLVGIGGKKYLSALVDCGSMVFHTKSYAEIVKDYFLRRKLKEIGLKFVSMSSDSEEDIDALLIKANNLISEISIEKSKNNIVRINEVMQDVASNIADNYANSCKLLGLDTGFIDLNAITGGLQKGTLNILAARPGAGKTSLALNIGENVAKQKNRVLVFSLEMSKEQLANRIISTNLLIDTNDLARGNFAEDVLSKTMSFCADYKSPIFIDDSSNLTVSDIRYKTQCLINKYGSLDLIIIDYLQLLTPKTKRENRNVDITEISRSLKTLAREFNVPVLALSQLSRAVESRTDKRPLLADLRDSGAIENDADIVAFIYRDDYYNQDSEEKGIAEIIIAKQRFGDTGTIKLGFDSSKVRFLNLI